ncbi:MAG TPA: GYD domain-containing protein [Stellaceae bacterium]|nr:GYD domain-containing protein [Stellaceae bacterium]
MTKYLIEANYTAEGLKGLREQKATSRKAVISKLIKDLGGTVEVFYWSFGERDAIVVMDLPDANTAAALALTISSSGLVHTRTTQLMTADEVDKAFKKTVPYRPPGK